MQGLFLNILAVIHYVWFFYYIIANNSLASSKVKVLYKKEEAFFYHPPWQVSTMAELLGGTETVNLSHPKTQDLL